MLVVEVELRIDVDEVHVGLVIGVDRADVAPVGVAFAVLVAEREGVHGMRADHSREDVVAEVVAAERIGRVAAELFEEEVGGETIDAHRRQRQVRRAGHRRRVGHLLAKLADPARRIDLHRAELGGRRPRHRQRADRDVGPARLVGIDERLVVHLVNVIAGEHDDQSRRRHLQGIDVLVDRVGCALVPVLVHPLLRREDVEKLAELAAEEPMPAEVEVAVEAAGLVLREQQDPPQAAVETVGEGEVHDPVDAAERHGRLGPVAGQGIEPRSLPARQHDGDDVTHPT